MISIPVLCDIKYRSDIVSFSVPLQPAYWLIKCICSNSSKKKKKPMGDIN